MGRARKRADETTRQNFRPVVPAAAVRPPGGLFGPHVGGAAPPPPPPFLPRRGTPRKAARRGVILLGLRFSRASGRRPPAVPTAPPVPPASPFAGQPELSVKTLVQEVLSRNPTLVQMVAAWQAAQARPPQAKALEDPMLN